MGAGQVSGCSRKRVIPVVNHLSSYAMRQGIFLKQPLADQILDGVVEVKIKVSLAHGALPF